MRTVFRGPLLGALVVGLLLQSCGSSDEKKRVPAPQGGEGGGPADGGEPTLAGSPSGAATSQGGAGGAAETLPGGAAGTSAGGAGGEPASECPAGFGECDGDLSEACEQDLTSVETCGDCDTSCTNEHGSVVCEDLACAITSCDDGYADCNDDATDGCETNLTDNDQHCGACGRDCTVASATCNVDSCGDIPMQQNVSIGTGNGPFNDRAFAFSSQLGIANTTRVNAVIRFFGLDGTTSKVIWDTVSGQSGNEALLIEGQDIVWAQSSGGTTHVVRKKAVSADSAALPTDLYFPEDFPVYLRSQGAYHYWIAGDFGEPGYVYRRLRSAASDVPGTRIVEVNQGSAMTISGFAVTTDAIYWVTADDGNAGTLDNDIRTTPLTGGVPTSVPKVPGATDGQIKDFGNFTIIPNLTAVGDTLYFARTIGDSTLNGVYRYKQGDAAPTKVAEAENVTTFAVGDDWVYYGLLNQQGVWRAPIGGGQGVMVGKSYQTTIVGVDDTFAYVAFVNSPAYFYKIFQ